MEDNHLEEVPTSKKNSPTLPTSSDGLLKLKLNLDLDANHPLSLCCQGLKNRGVKSIDYSLLIAEALLQVDPHWWEKKTDELIPLDLKLQEALQDPDLRSKLADFLSSHNKSNLS
ncbi:MAG: hypothetical protein KBD78_12870 [Oligoflexales bacterium]|nr:hypothetical protein [Oligoflexales bacterium]